MNGATPSWREELNAWLEPFVGDLGDRRRRRMCPLYVAGLIGPGDRKSIRPMAAREEAAGYDQLHHFVASGLWDSVPLEAALLAEADRLVGGEDAYLIIDDTALPKKGRHSVGVAPQYATTLGKNANCQTPVSTTLARAGVPVMVGLKLFLPESWTSDPARLERARVPANERIARTKPIDGRPAAADSRRGTRPRSSGRRDHGRRHAFETQGADKGSRFPVSMGHAAAEALTPRRAPVPPRHLGAGPRLVDEDELLRIEVELALEPGFASHQDVGTVLLRRMWGLFSA